MSDSSPIFRLKGVTQRFGRLTALTEINLTLYPGERVALVGSSGAGKSTLLRLLNGTQQPTQGKIWALGYNLSQLSTRRLRQVQRQIGTIYQQFHLVDNLRVIHNVNAGHLGRWSLFKAALSLLFPLEIETAHQALTQVGIPDKIYTRTDQLSGGQQQRVALARVLIQNPLVILADEPISSLDPELSREVIELLCQMSEQGGKTLVTSLHSVDFALRYYHRIIGLKMGKILFDSSATNVSTEMIDQLYKI